MIVFGWQQAIKLPLIMRLALFSVLVLLSCFSALGAKPALTARTNDLPANVAEVPRPLLNPRIVRLPVVDGKGIRFTHLSTEDGLSQTRVSQIVQDDDGFMWFGTQYGLNRYDGYKFRIFKHEPGRADSLSGVFIYSLFKDRSGSLWVGSDKFLDKFDPVTETFKHYRIGTRDLEDGISPVTQISQDRTGMLWLATSTGLYKLDPSSGRTTNYRHHPDDPFSLSSDSIRATYESRNGTLWVATSEGVDAFDRNTEKVTLSIHFHETNEISLAEDFLGILWIGHVTGEGLEAFDSKTNTLTHYSFHERPVSGSAPTGVQAILEDRDRTLWLATRGSGLLKYDRKYSRFIRFRHGTGDTESLSQNSVTSLFQDREGNMWASMYMMGPDRWSTRPPLFEKFRHVDGNPNSLSDTMVDSIFEDRHGILWIGSTTALNRIDRKTGKYKYFTIGDPGANTDATTTTEDGSGALWVGTSGHGLNRLDPKTGHFRTFTNNPADSSSLSSDIVSRLLIDHTGTLWAATFDGLDRFDPATSRFTVYRAENQNAAQIDTELQEDRAGALWIGTHYSGLQHFNPATGKFTIYKHNPADPTTLSDNRVMSVHFDRSGTMWIGTQNGLDKFDPATGRFVAFYQQNGLPGNVVNCVLGDKNDNLWISTNNGLSKFNPSKNTFTNYYTADGLPGPDLTGWGACFQSSSGEMFFGGFSGGVAFHPEDVVDTPYLPPVMFTGLRLSGIPVMIGGGSPLAESIGHTHSLSLSHDNSNFSLEFAALSYFNSAANRYRYRLEGLDSQWHEVDSNQRLVTYTTLPAGSYTFRLQGATTRSDWTEPGLTMRIAIQPAWWNTWWFRMMYVAIILLSVWAAYRYRLHQLAEQYTARMEERVNERTRIARELHDTLLQSLQGLIFRFQVATEQIPESVAARGYLEDALERSEQVMAEGRDRVRDLRMTPVESDDLPHAFAAVGNDLKQNYPANFTVAITGDCRDLQPIVRDEFYRIGREALTNAFRHAGAAKIEAEIAYELTEFCVQFRDDGCGIEPGIVASGCRSDHWGLTGMRERAQQIGAKMEIWSRPGGGTKIEFRIPAAIAYEGGLRGSRWGWLLRLAGGGSR